MHTLMFIYLFSAGSKESTCGRGRVHTLRWQRLQQRQHNIKRFVTSALPMSFRCHGDTTILRIDIFSVILGAKQIVHTRYSRCLATSTLRMSFRCHVGAIIVISTLAGRQLLERALCHLKFVNRGKYRNKKNKIAPRPSSAILFNILDGGERCFLFSLQIRSLSQSSMVSRRM